MLNKMNVVKNQTGKIHLKENNKGQAIKQLTVER